MHKIVAVLLTSWLASSALANSVGLRGYSGKAGFNCNVCHTDNVPAPTVSFEGPTQMAPNEIATFTFTVDSNGPAQAAAGIGLAASGGTLTTINGQGTRQQTDEITHNDPKDNNANGITTWMFRWRAPTTPGNYVLYGSGNSVNLNNALSGDRAASTQLRITVGNVTPVATATATITTTATATRSATPSVSAAASATPSPTPTDAPPTLTPTPTVPPTLTPTPPPTPSATNVHTATATATSSATASPTSTASVTQTATATHTRTPTLTPSPTARVPGDANCDGGRGVADVVQVVAVLGQVAADCGGADTNGDGSINDSDVIAAAQALYAD